MEQLETVKIEDEKKQGDFVIINESDFDKQKHKLFVEKKEKPKPKDSEEKKNSEEPKEDEKPKTEK